jgi:hypothetical protein
MFFFKIRQEKGLWIGQCKRLESFVKLMSKNSISVLWWKLVKKEHAVYSLLWKGQLICELLSTPAAGIYWKVCIPTCVKTSQPSCQVGSLVNPMPSLSLVASVWAEGGEMQAHTDRQADLCMIFRLTCAWFAGWLMHDFQADLCMIFRLTYAWFAGWLMHDFQVDLHMIFRPTYALFSDWLMHDFSGWLMHDFPRLCGWASHQTSDGKGRNLDPHTHKFIGHHGPATDPKYFVLFRCSSRSRLGNDLFKVINNLFVF